MRFILIIFLFPIISQGEEFIVFGPSAYLDSTTTISWMEQAPNGIFVITKEANELDKSERNREIFGIPTNTVVLQALANAIKWIAFTATTTTNWKGMEWEEEKGKGRGRGGFGE